MMHSCGVLTLLSASCLSCVSVGAVLLQAARGGLPSEHAALLQGVYEPHHDIHMQPYPEGAGPGFNDQGYRSSSLPALHMASTDRLHSGVPAPGKLPPPCQQWAPHVICLST